MRTTSLQITPEQHAAMCAAIDTSIGEQVKAAIAAQDRGAYDRITAIPARMLLPDAIGYLSLWALPQDDAPQGYHHVVIRCADAEQPELVACYYHDVTSTTPGYVIGAIWHGDHFGFHS